MKHVAKVLVVDDDDAYRTMLREVLGDLHVDVACVCNGQEALQYLESHKPSLVLLDVRMPVLNGLDTLRAMRERNLTVPTVMLTAHADLDDAVQAMKLGAADYLRKPIDILSLESLIQRFATGRRTAQESSLPPLPSSAIFSAPIMRDLLEELARIANSDAPVLLHGETGTGKEVLADLVHRWSPRHEGPLVPVNMAALPDSLIESELFGHTAGAFTGAERARDGRFQEAHHGTLFLDEIGEMPLALQPKILRALETKRVTQLGDTKERVVDFRLVTATNRDLEAEAEAGRFREDLYYRVAVIMVEVPPLRERREDILPLARHLLGRASRDPKRLSTASENILMAHAWPGNIRELDNAMQRAAILAAGEVILPESLAPHIRKSVAHLDDGQRDVATALDDLSLAAMEKRAILDALARSDGNRSEAARALGISRRKLLYRLKAYGTTGDEPGPGEA
jgi:two-component system, NtrC family, response regulator HydG